MIKSSNTGKQQNGFTLFLTGLSGAGKTSIASQLAIQLEKIEQYRKISLLDGDVVRENLSSELDFSKAHRDLNVQRIAYVASEINKHGGIAICALIAPFATARQKAKAVISQQGGFIEIYVATPLSECERRDCKGLYAKARAGEIENFTGLSSPYEPPENPDICLNTEDMTLQQCVDVVLQYLKAQGYIHA